MAAHGLAGALASGHLALQLGRRGFGARRSPFHLNEERIAMTASNEPQPLRLLTVTAHPHDVTYTLGTSAHHIERGDSVTVVSLSDGVTTHDEELEDEMRKPASERRAEILERPRSAQASRKQGELARVCGLFGIEDVRVLPFADNPLETSRDLLNALTDILHEIRPHIVITQPPYNCPYRNMTSLWDHDHCLTGQLVAQAMQRAAQADARRDRSPLHVAQVFYIGVQFGWTDIDLFVDISDQVARRIEAEALYETQGHTSEFARKRIEAFAGYHGWFSRAGYAEPFIRERAQTSDYLTVTSNDLRLASQSGRENLERVGQFASGRDAGEGG